MNGPRGDTTRSTEDDEGCRALSKYPFFFLLLVPLQHPAVIARSCVIVRHGGISSLVYASARTSTFPATKHACRRTYNLPASVAVPGDLSPPVHRATVRSLLFPPFLRAQICTHLMAERYASPTSNLFPNYLGLPSHFHVVPGPAPSRRTDLGAGSVAAGTARTIGSSGLAMRPCTYACTHARRLFRQRHPLPICISDHPDIEHP